MSCVCNWRFTNISRAFEAVAETRARYFFVYSDVGESYSVGNQVMDLMRGVNFRRQGEGNQYFEPLHNQYILLRKKVLDIIKIQVAETSCDLRPDDQSGDGFVKDFITTSDIRMERL